MNHRNFERKWHFQLPAGSTFPPVAPPTPSGAVPPLPDRGRCAPIRLVSAPTQGLSAAWAACEALSYDASANVLLILIGSLGHWLERGPGAWFVEQQCSAYRLFARRLCRLRDITSRHGVT